MSTPRVTVLMPVFNGEKYLGEAIESILNQTFADFEFLIINDGSTDNSVSIIQSYPDSRIKLLHNDGNRGLIATLNRGIEFARGEYIARMDCDDISLPKRLAKQMEFMDQHQEVGVCGTWISTIGRNKVVKPPTEHDAIVCRLMFESCLLHPTVIIRRSVLRENGIFYDHGYLHAEDYELWVRCSKFCKLANLGEVLFHYRIHPHQVSEVYSRQQIDSANRVKLLQLEGVGVVPTTEEVDLHFRLWPPSGAPHKEFLDDAEKWLLKLKAGNVASARYSADCFKKELTRVWFSVCVVATTRSGQPTLKRFFRSPLSSLSSVTVRQIIGMFLYNIARKNC